MKTMSERIEAAAEMIEHRVGADGTRLERDLWEVAKGIARLELRAAFPELFGDQPQAWLAPWDASVPMYRNGDATFGMVDQIWETLRDAHLSTPPTLTKEGREQ